MHTSKATFIIVIMNLTTMRGHFVFSQHDKNLNIRLVDESIIEHVALDFVFPQRI